MLISQLWRGAIRWLSVLVASVALLAAASSVESARAAPAFVLDPDRARCDGRIVARGSGFPSGETIALIAFLPGGGNATEPGRVTVAADGTFTLPVAVHDFAGPCDGPYAVPTGTRFTINAVLVKSHGQGGPLASAAFTLVSSSTPGLPNTGGGVQAPIPDPPSQAIAVATLGLVAGSVGLYIRHRQRSMHSGATDTQ